MTRCATPRCKRARRGLVAGALHALCLECERAALAVFGMG